MNYFFQKTLINSSFDKTIEKVTEELINEGFGVLTEIDLKATFKQRLGVNFRNYHILGACSPAYAYKALQSEINLGTMLPCNVVVMENDEGSIDISIVDPVVSLMAIENEDVKMIAEEIRDKLKNVVAKIL